MFAFILFILFYIFIVLPIIFISYILIIYFDIINTFPMIFLSIMFVIKMNLYLYNINSAKYFKYIHGTTHLCFPRTSPTIL